MSHIAQHALSGEMPKGPCRVCDKGAIKRGQVDCRGGAPLNGREAAHEFTRHLRIKFRTILLTPRKPKAKP